MVLPGPTDPFYELMHPPPDETSAQTAARLKRELDAQRVSDSIDEDIKQERAKEKKKKNVIKVLLLGQAESGEHLLIFITMVRFDTKVITLRKIHNTQKYGFPFQLYFLQSVYIMFRFSHEVCKS
jgi:hypothetical protein